MKTSKYFFCLSLMLLLLDCELKNAATPIDSETEELLKAGWEQFEANNYPSALDNFEAALVKDSSYAEAYNGAGWASARLTSLSNSVSYFTQCITFKSSLADAHAGLAFVYNALKQYQPAIAAANNALSLSSAWLFSHDQTIGYKDLYLLLAASYFALGDFSLSLVYVKKLNTLFTVDITTYEGRSKLAEEIERLRGIV